MQESSPQPIPTPKPLPAFITAGTERGGCCPPPLLPSLQAVKASGEAATASALLCLGCTRFSFGSGGQSWEPLHSPGECILRTLLQLSPMLHPLPSALLSPRGVTCPAGRVELPTLLCPPGSGRRCSGLVGTPAAWAGNHCPLCLPDVGELLAQGCFQVQPDMSKAPGPHQHRVPVLPSRAEGGQQRRSRAPATLCVPIGGSQRAEPRGNVKSCAQLPAEGEQESHCCAAVGKKGAWSLQRSPWSLQRSPLGPRETLSVPWLWQGRGHHLEKSLGSLCCA